MSAWAVAATILPLAFVPCVIVGLFSQHPIARLAALEMATVVLVFELVFYAQATGRVPFYDLPLALTLLSFGSGLVFAHFLARSL